MFTVSVSFMSSGAETSNKTAYSARFKLHGTYIWHQKRGARQRVAKFEPKQGNQVKTKILVQVNAIHVCARLWYWR
jgi:hypothetical protein